MNEEWILYSECIHVQPIQTYRENKTKHKSNSNDRRSRNKMKKKTKKSVTFSVYEPHFAHSLKRFNGEKYKHIELS